MAVLMLPPPSDASVSVVLLHPMLVFCCPLHSEGSVISVVLNLMIMLLPSPPDAIVVGLVLFTLKKAVLGVGFCDGAPSIPWPPLYLCSARVRRQQWLVLQHANLISAR